MRLKQLLGIVLLAGVSAMAADTVSQSGDVQVTNQNSAAAQKAGATTRIGKISVARGGDGLNIEISGSGPMTAKTMKLTHPDRVVVDIPNSVLQGRAREIPVNSGDVKSVRVGRYQEGTTRIVVDMAQMRDFQIAPEGNKLVVSMRDSSTSKPAPLPTMKEAVVTADATPQTAAPEPVAQPRQPQKLKKRSWKPRAPDLMWLLRILPVPRQRCPASTSLHSPRMPAWLPNPQSSMRPCNTAAGTTTPAGTTVSVSGPTSTNCTTGRYTGEPFGMNFKDLDLKDFFRLIHEISGLNVVLDPSVKGSVTIVLDDVPWDQALAIVLDNNGLACTLQGNVLRIATLETMKTEAESRRAQQDAQALAVPKQTITRYLSYGHARDAATVVKKFLSARGDVVADERSNALIIEDIPAVLPKVEELIRMLDRKTPEVEIEARVVASTRTFARDIGTQLGASFGSGNSAVGGATDPSPIDISGAGSTIHYCAGRC